MEFFHSSTFGNCLSHIPHDKVTIWIRLITRGLTYIPHKNEFSIYAQGLNTLCMVYYSQRFTEVGQCKKTPAYFKAGLKLHIFRFM